MNERPVAFEQGRMCVGSGPRNPCQDHDEQCASDGIK
jgi:hypothetical protein